MWKIGATCANTLVKVIKNSDLMKYRAKLGSGILIIYVLAFILYFWSKDIATVDAGIFFLIFLLSIFLSRSDGSKLENGSFGFFIGFLGATYRFILEPWDLITNYGVAFIEVFNYGFLLHNVKWALILGFSGTVSFLLFKFMKEDHKKFKFDRKAEEKN